MLFLLLLIVLLSLSFPRRRYRPMMWYGPSFYRRPPMMHRGYRGMGPMGGPVGGPMGGPRGGHGPHGGHHGGRC